VPPFAVDLIELAVGGACLAAAIAIRRRGLRAVGVVVGLAGLAAVVHAVWSMAAR
jgi:hypothetical protein